MAKAATVPHKLTESWFEPLLVVPVALEVLEACVAVAETAEALVAADAE